MKLIIGIFHFKDLYYASDLKDKNKINDYVDIHEATRGSRKYPNGHKAAMTIEQLIGMERTTTMELRQVARECWVLFGYQLPSESEATKKQFEDPETYAMGAAMIHELQQQYDAEDFHDMKVC